MGDGDFFPVILTIVSVFTIAELAMRRPWLGLGVPCCIPFFSSQSFSHFKKCTEGN